MNGVDPAFLAGVAAEPAYLRLPRAAEVFRRRAARLRELAEAHASGDWLVALGRICEAQQLAAETIPGSLAGRDLARAHPLHFAEWRRDPSWRGALALILTEMRAASLPQPAREAAVRLETASADEIEVWADALLSGSAGPSPAAAPFLAAALQAHFATLAGRIPGETIERSAQACPVCASPPIAGLVMGDDKVRYLVCSLCATEWHLVRVKCATCGSSAALTYLSIEGHDEGIKAEACGACGTYLKLFYRERLPSADALADDAATLALDLLVSERGYSRGGANPFVATLAATALNPPP
jgi:FdhE protein